MWVDCEKEAKFNEEQKMRVHSKLKRKKKCRPVSHSSSELLLKFSCYSGWLKRHFQILQERKNSSSQTTQIKSFQKQLQVLLSLSTNWALFDSFLFHVSLTFPILFWATLLKACVLEFIKKIHNTVTAYFSTGSIAIPDSCAARSTVYHSALGWGCTFQL